MRKSIVVPSAFFFRMKLMTPEIASEPYTADALPLRISTRSISDARDVRDVGEIAVAAVGLRIVGDAPAVDQHQRVIRTEPAQIDRLCAGREAVGDLVVVERAEVLRERGHDVGDGAKPWRRCPAA